MLASFSIFKKRNIKVAAIATLSTLITWTVISANSGPDISDATERFSSMGLVKEIDKDSILLFVTGDESGDREQEINFDHVSVIQTDEYQDLSMKNILIGDKIIVQGVTDETNYFGKRIISFDGSPNRENDVNFSLLDFLFDEKESETESDSATTTANQTPSEVGDGTEQADDSTASSTDETATTTNEIDEGETATTTPNQTPPEVGDGAGQADDSTTSSTDETSTTTDSETESDSATTTANQTPPEVGDGTEQADDGTSADAESSDVTTEEPETPSEEPTDTPEEPEEDLTDEQT